MLLCILSFKGQEFEAVIALGDGGKRMIHPKTDHQRRVLLTYSFRAWFLTTLFLHLWRIERATDVIPLTD